MDYYTPICIVTLTTVNTRDSKFYNLAPQVFNFLNVYPFKKALIDIILYIFSFWKARIKL